MLGYAKRAPSRGKRLAEDEKDAIMVQIERCASARLAQ